MRLPRRETQIFSLSMMDVISGAMGAFLIIMVILMRYYKEDDVVTAQREAVQKQLEDIQRKIDEAIERMQATTDVDVKDLLKRFQELQEQLTDARQQVNQLSDDLQAARNRADAALDRNDQLAQENSRLESEKSLIRPFMVIAQWNSAKVVNVNVSLEPSVTTTKGERFYFNPASTSQKMFRGDLHWDGVGTNGTDVWMFRETRHETTFKVYIALYPESDGLVPASVRVYTYGDSMSYSYETIELSAQKQWELVGILTTDNTGKTTARNVSEEERRRDRSEVESRVRKSASENN